MNSMSDLDSLFKNYNHLGFNNPYYFIDNFGKFRIYERFPEAIENFYRDRKLDYVSVVEFLNRNYMLADRTIVEGLYHTPWMAKPNFSFDQWINAPLPEHGNNLLPEEDIALILFEKLCSEIENCIGSRKKIGVLLSGGMDSRMMAGALDYLIKTETIKNVEITALTWGNEGTRDVAYAYEIAKRLNWKWKCYRVSAKDLINNIYETAQNGCEYSPIHLHAIPQIRDDNEDLDIILAASYGDGIGRAEYSKWKIRNAPPLNDNVSNFSYLLSEEVVKRSIAEVRKDIRGYHLLYPTNNKIAKKERDFQLHYMRRMLNPCMNLLQSEKTVLYQVFTSPQVYEFIWGISIERRTDRIYEFMYNQFKTPLKDIPWSRTGREYLQTSGKYDNLLKDHHNYYYIIEHELLDEIEDMISVSPIYNANIFNRNSIRKLFDIIKDHPNYNINSLYLEKLIWLASLAKFIEIYDIHIPQSSSSIVSNKNIAIHKEYHMTALKNRVKPYIKNILNKSWSPKIF
jgi:asparagine synthase (glutamine-hydrolysing)